MSLTAERLALYVCKDGKVEWSRSTRDFGWRLANGTELSRWSLAYDFFSKGRVPTHPETVSANAWAPNASDDEEVKEHAFPLSNFGTVMSLVWFPVS